MTADKVAKTYVRPDRTAVLTCPQCGMQKTIRVDTFKEHKHALKIKCSCQQVFTVKLEFRKRVRKQTYLRGTYVNHSQNGATGNIIVRNVSLSGLEFNSMDVPHFKVDDELTLEFTLDDEHLSEIRKDAVVIDVRRNSVGCEFTRSGEFAYDGPLGFYIMS